jgi:hypothetical protein
MLTRTVLYRIGPLYCIAKLAKHAFDRWRYDSRLLKNVNRTEEKPKKRALLVYLTRPFLMDQRSKLFVAHQNSWGSLEIARLLGELGYIVDVLNWDNHRTQVDPDYDLLLGFGRAGELARKLSERTVKIFFATGSLDALTSQREKERIEDVNRRRGCNLKPVRYIGDSSGNLKYFDAIVSFGNEGPVNTFRPYFEGPIYELNNHGYDQWIGIPKDKDFEKARNNLLYFASSGQILTGLDLVLDAFISRPNLNLFVCGPYEKERDFVECFQKELYETKNIVPVGWVTVGSAQYFELMRRCSATIFPVFGGGSPGSVVVCMECGVIPIISKEAGISTGDFGITLSSNTVDDIGRAIDWVSGQSAQWHEEMSHKVVEAYRLGYTQVAFTQRFREILNSIKSRSSLT